MHKEFCLNCHEELNKYEVLLCSRCEGLHSRWVDRNFSRVALMNGNPIEIWIEERKNGRKT
jgi:hypothetical protein